MGLGGAVGVVASGAGAGLGALDDAVLVRHKVSLNVKVVEVPVAVPEVGGLWGLAGDEARVMALEAEGEFVRGELPRVPFGPVRLDQELDIFGGVGKVAVGAHPFR